MTLKQIEYFQMVCEKGNISAAADALYVSRSVVSRTIAEIEETFGVPMFTRLKSGVVLTEYGKVVASLFNTFANNLAATSKRIEQIQQAHCCQVLRLGVTPTNIYTIYHVYLEKFMQAYPNIPLKIEEHSAFDAWDLLQNGSLDAFFTTAPPNTRIFKTIDLYENPIMLGVAKNDPLRKKKNISIADLLHLPLAFFNAPMPIETILNAAFAVFEKQPNVILRTSDLMLIKDLTAAHKVYPLLPKDTMSTWREIHPIPLDFFHSSINRLVWSHALPCTKELKTFLDFMHTQIPMPG